MPSFPRLLARPGALLAALLAAGVLASSAAAQDVPVPDTPAGRRLAPFLETVFQRGDSASVIAFVNANMDAEYRGMPASEHLGVFSSIREQLRGGRLVAVEAASPTRLRAMLQPVNGPRLRVDLAVEAAPPHQINALGVGPEQPERVPEAFTADQVREVVEGTAGVLERSYVDADTGALIAKHLRDRLAAGAYASLTRPADLADAVTTDLRAINGDRHLSLSPRPGGGGGGGGGGTPNDAERRGNYGFARVERLEGNVGYLKLTGISGADQAREVAVNALEFLQGTDAVILDLRGVPGGSGQMANFLISHFTPPNQPSLRIYRRQGNRTEERATLAEVPGPRRTEVPLYVLIDGGAASAAEDIPFVLQNLGRATLVGERTAGAGHNNAFIPAGHGMAVSVSVTRVSDPRTGREWEQVGVQPDVRAPSHQALQAAHEHALRALAAAEQDAARKTVLSATAEYVAASAAPAAVPAQRLAAAAGRYTGGRLVTVDGGRLYFQRQADAPRQLLVPLADGRFAMGPVLRVTFADGRMEIGEPGGPARVFTREN